ncbi:MAG: helix-turn-helix domain-containing protein [Frankiaceae bacterium]
MAEIADQTELGELLRGLRHERLLRLQDVARRAGLEPSTLSRYERGLIGVGWPLFQRVLAGLDLQARVVIERRYVDVDGEIDRMAALPVVERLGPAADDVALVAAALVGHGVRFALAGATAAVVLGVPLPLRCLQLAVAEDDLEVVPAAMRSCWGRLVLPAGDPLAYAGAREVLRQRPVTPWRLLASELELASMPAAVLERATRVRLGAEDVPVLPLDALLVEDPALRRTLDRFAARQSIASPP